MRHLIGAIFKAFVSWGGVRHFPTAPPGRGCCRLARRPVTGWRTAPRKERSMSR